ncbi:MAG: hypothetical protein RSC99_03740 [Clostridiales bacterium]
MKKVSIFLILLFLLLFLSSCGQIATIKGKNIDYGNAYNIKTGVNITLDESVASVNKKFNKDEYQRIDNEDGSYRYVLKENSYVVFGISFISDKVSGFGFIPQADGYDSQAVLDMSLLETDWCFKGGISIKTSKEEVDKSFGIPSLEYTDNKGTYQCEYGFTEDFSIIPKEDYGVSYKRNSPHIQKYRATILYQKDQLWAIDIGKLGNIPVGNGST